ncbi:putative modified peptide [Xanthomonas sp. Kuri4-1]
MPTLKLEPTVASTLIELLATDDIFRQLFVSDTAAALLQAGHVPAEGEDLQAFVQACCQNIQLADKATIAGARDEISTMLTNGTSYNVPMLEEGADGTRTLK